MDFLDLYYYSDCMGENDNADMERASRQAFALVLAKIMEKELTERQRICLHYKYVKNMTQYEISQKLKISQPSVSRHIAAAKKIVNNKLQYCYLALSKALTVYGKSY